MLPGFPQSQMPSTSPPVTSNTTGSFEHSCPSVPRPAANTPSSDSEALGDSREDFEIGAQGSTADSVARIRDLTGEITLVEQHAVAYGGCSDIYCGEWVPSRGKENTDQAISVSFRLVWVAFLTRLPQVALKVPRTSKGMRDSTQMQKVGSQLTTGK